VLQQKQAGLIMPTFTLRAHMQAAADMSQQLAAAEAESALAHATAETVQNATACATAAAAAVHLLARALPPLLHRLHALEAKSVAACAVLRCTGDGSGATSAQLVEELRQLAQALAGNGTSLLAGPNVLVGQSTRAASWRAAVVAVIAANRLVRLGLQSRTISLR
jgi:hydroxypyruvate isomerase